MCHLFKVTCSSIPISNKNITQIILDCIHLGYSKLDNIIKYIMVVHLQESCDHPTAYNGSLKTPTTMNECGMNDMIFSLGFINHFYVLVVFALMFVLKLQRYLDVLLRNLI